MPVVECDPETARERLAEHGVEVRPGNTDHERWRATHEGATAVAYDSKVVVQGEDAAVLEGLVRGEAGGRAHVYFDGASRGNPGPAAVGYVVVTDGGVVVEGGERVGTATNNQAEYAALERALRAAAARGFEEVVVRGDSELVLKQVRGEYDTNDPALREARVRVRGLLEEFEEWSLVHVPREINERADQLANDALDE